MHKIDYISANCKHCGAPIPEDVQNKLKKKFPPKKEDNIIFVMLYGLFVCLFLIAFQLVTGKFQ